MKAAPDPRLARHLGAELIAAAALGEAGAQSIVLGEGLDRLDIIAIRLGDDYCAFVNECPHAGTPLETFDGAFLDAEDPSILVCSTHGARFRANDGICVGGVCLGMGLKPVPVSVTDGVLRIAAVAE